jgi:hypothetical protein
MKTSVLSILTLYFLKYEFITEAEVNMKKLFSRQSILPDRTNHNDEHGHKVGYSRPSLLFSNALILFR